MKYQVLFSHDEPHSTIDAGIIAEGSGNDGGLAAGTEGIGLEMLPQGVEEDISGTGDTAAHHKHLGVGGGGNRGQRHAQGVGHLVHLTGGQCIACTGGIKDILGGKVGAAQGAGGVRVLVQQLLHTADHAGGAGILLQTAVLAAAAGGGLVAVHRNVADLAACTVCTFDDPAVDDDTAADRCPA